VTAGPAPFNACDYLLDRHIREGRGTRLALTGVAGDVSYAELAERVAHAARGLRGLGLQAEQRVVMVMAAHDTDGLEKPVAFVLLSPGAIGDESALIEFCRSGLPSFKRPRRIVFVTGYPTTSTGKIRRVDLRARAAVIMQAEPEPPPAPVVPL
jgi:acyl-coenzyme A synthetase/AMP-(fatty) acid ligase